MSSEFRGLDKVVDRPNAIRALRRPGSSCNSPSRNASHVFDGPAIAPQPAGRRHEFTRSSSKTSIFGAEESYHPKTTGRRHCSATNTPRGTSPVNSRPSSALPEDAPGVARPKLLGGRKLNLAVSAKPSALSAEAMKPLAPGEKPEVLGPKDNYSHRPHSARHGRAHLASENRTSVLFHGGAPGEASMRRYDRRFVATPTNMKRFECRPEAVRTVGINQQDTSVPRKGKATFTPRSQSLDGVLRPDSRPPKVDASYRPAGVLPWR